MSDPAQLAAQTPRRTAVAIQLHPVHLRPACCAEGGIDRSHRGSDNLRAHSVATEHESAAHLWVL